MKETILFWQALFDFILKHKNKVWKQFTIKIEDTRPMSWTYFKFLSTTWLWTGNPLFASYWKDNTFEDKIGYIMRYVYLKSEKLLTNTIWIYNITCALPACLLYICQL